MPGRFRDYEMTEMSVKEDIRRAPSSVREDDGVGGMLEDDNHGAVSNRTGSGATTRLDKPDSSDSRETRATCIGGVISGLKELCRMNRINEIQMASLIGRVTIDLCAKIEE